MSATKTKTNAAKLAPRLKSLEGARLGLYLARPGGSSKQTERSVYGLLRGIAALIEEAYPITGVREWHRASASRRSPLEMLDEIAAESDAVLIGMGDCHHGSACSLTEVWELEQRCVPVAYVDTPRRVPRIEKHGDVFVIDYFMLEKRVPRWKRQGMEKLRGEFELQGINRALRQAGATEGDRVRLLDFEFELEELPPAPKGWLPSSDGIDGYSYIVTAPIGRMEQDEVKALAADLLPDVIKKLVTV